MKIIIVDDEKNIRQSLKILFEQEGFEVDCAENGLSGQRFILDNRYDAAIFDLKMPGLSGLELLDWVDKSGIKLKVIMISAFGEVEDAVSALKKGAADYIVKPFDPEVLIDKIKLITSELNSSINLSNGNTYITNENPKSATLIMQKINERVKRIASSNSTVLITGESGVGKEVTAREIHQLSSRCNEPFIALNMGGISESLTESELFGYEKGAFTGANTTKTGLLEQAKSGTLFLDEVGEMPQSLQIKLLRVLQDKKFKRLGGVTDIDISSRLITATNRNLEEMVKSGDFREDLFYRLNIARIELPPLRDRKEDLESLVDTLLKKLNISTGQSVTGLTVEAWNKLFKYHFPGNIRELENILERAMIFIDGNEINHDDLEFKIESIDESEESSTIVTPPFIVENRAKTLKEMERESIIEALCRWEGNRSKAALELGISRRTIINKIKEYDLD